MRDYRGRNVASVRGEDVRKHAFCEFDGRKIRISAAREIARARAATDGALDCAFDSRGRCFVA
jgi:hypothetical protein